MLASTPTHEWLKEINVAYVPGSANGLEDRVARELVDHFHQRGQTVESTPTADTRVILTTASLGKPLGWREALLFTARRRYRLKQVPTVITILHALPGQFSDWLARAGQIAKGVREAVSTFAGIPETAFETLYQQGKRGGAILCLLRILQIQTKSIRLLLTIGRDEPDSAFLFDLVGAHPQIEFLNPQSFYRDIATRILTAASTDEITNHQVVEPPIKQEVWSRLSTVEEMIRASREFGRRDFFTEMIRISQVAEVPGLNEAISSQYSEGCFATWEAQIPGLLTTITGSARPVSKESITDSDLAVVVGIKAELDGALIRKVEGHANQPPSSEAVEMFGMDLQLPRVPLKKGLDVPVIRSKLHGHRGVRSFDRKRVEYAPLPESYLHYPVSCSTDAQYRAVQQAFSHSSTLQYPQDPRQVVFTVLPGHGMVIAEKWVEEKQAFQLIWEAMDRGDVDITNDIPQGPFTYESDGQRCTIAGSQTPSILKTR
jgi:hypothetical protein